MTLDEMKLAVREVAGGDYMLKKSDHLTRTPEQRFWAKVKKNEVVTSPHVKTPCWNWTGGKDRVGYGRFWLNGKLVSAHRFSAKLASLDIPETLMACHKCDNKSCCNPEHLFVGTNSDNQKDAHAKGIFGGHRWNSETAKLARSNRL